MASFSLSRSLLLLLLMIVIALFSRFSISEATSSFSFTSSDKNASFKSNEIALFGDAKLVDGGSSIQLTDSVSLGGGRVVYKKPIESVDTVTDYFVGFSTVFSFSMSPGRGGRLGFVVFPANGTFDQPLLQVKFDFSENFTKFRDSNVTVIVDGTTVSHKINNLTIVLDKEKKDNLLLYAWISYQASGRFIDVHLCRSESFKAVHSHYISRIDLLKETDELMVGVKSYSGNFDLHSWRLEARHFPRNMHSYAALMESKRTGEEEAKRRRRKRMWGIVTCFVMTFGSTGLVFFAMMHIWAAFKRNYLAIVMQEECGIKTKEFGYEKMEKMEVVMSKADAKQETK
ncbi:uncharacterized protein LOC111830399 [Capsella rubella]|uniref:uncharacterized protein LOC111830399 n=1 Tax=Capsella rubella TaxID=81985 RepID=UPI000CD59FA3|nr:uncharacterized protein LOC111830399 [Capsella rubella]